MALGGYEYLHLLIAAVQVQSTFAVGVGPAGEVSSVRISCQHHGPGYSRSPVRLDLEYHVSHPFLLARGPGHT